ncbi:helix-turn-helix domain-containing protein [Streptomyces sp. NPDC059718]
MGRHENPVADAVPAVTDLAALQRTWRERAGWTYDELAAVTGVPASTLRRAASGRGVPPQDVVRIAVAACGGPAEQIPKMWRKARYQQRLADKPRELAPALELVRTKGELSAAIVELYERNGAPPVMLMEKRVGRVRLGHSTAHRIVTRQTLPSDRGQFEAFLAALEIVPRLRRRWLLAWDQVMSRPSRTSHATIPHWRMWENPWPFTTEAELAAQVTELWVAAGAPSMSELSARNRFLGPSAVRSVLRGSPPNRAIFQAFLRALDLSERDWPAWERPLPVIHLGTSDRVA